MNPTKPGSIQRSHTAEATVSAGITTKGIKYTNIKHVFKGRDSEKYFYFVIFTIVRKQVNMFDTFLVLILLIFVMHNAKFR